MNQKKAKMLRKLAEQTAPGIATEYDHKLYTKVFYTIEGKAKTHTVYTRTMKPCTKKAYKELKKAYKKFH